MPWCNCIDYPCCGHDFGLGPESAEDFLNDLAPDEREFALSYMTPCPDCGEMRPKNDPAIKKHGCCYMCLQDPQRASSPVADANLRHFAEMRAEDKETIRRLERQVEELQRRQ